MWLGVWLGGSSRHAMPQPGSCCREPPQVLKTQRKVSGRPQRGPDHQPLPSDWHLGALSTRPAEMGEEHRQQGFASPGEPLGEPEGPETAPGTLLVLSPQPCGTMTNLTLIHWRKLRLREGKQLIWIIHECMSETEFEPCY